MPVSYGMEYVSGNFYTNQRQREINAIYAYKFLKRIVGGWTIQSIAAMCGNWEVESSINPGIWENLDYGNTSGGYGLVQWTPATKLINWAAPRQLDITDMATALLRIDWEAENQQQWTTTLPMSFTEFKHSTQSPYLLAQYFCRYYENPTSPDLNDRGQRGERWYNFLLTVPLGRESKFWMYYAPKWREMKGRL